MRALRQKCNASVICAHSVDSKDNKPFFVKSGKIVPRNVNRRLEAYIGTTQSVSARVNQITDVSQPPKHFNVYVHWLTSLMRSAEFAMYQPNYFSITEMWLSAKRLKGSYQLSGYNSYTSSRKSKTGGGTMLLVDSQIPTNHTVDA